MMEDVQAAVEAAIRQTMLGTASEAQRDLVTLNYLKRRVLRDFNPAGEAILSELIPAMAPVMGDVLRAGGMGGDIEAWIPIAACLIIAEAVMTRAHDQADGTQTLN